MIDKRSKKKRKVNEDGEAVDGEDEDEKDGRKGGTKRMNKR